MANILQVAYYRGPLVTRARMLESRGHHVTSVLGNDEAFRLDANIPVVALQFHSAESFPEADGGTVSDDPEVWLAAVANTLKKSG